MIRTVETRTKPPAAPGKLPLLPHRLRALREERGLTQAEVAEAIGMSEVNYNRIETGQVQLTTRVMALLRGFHDIGTGDLFEERPPQREVAIERVAEADLWISDPAIPEEQRDVALLAEDDSTRTHTLRAALVKGGHAADRYPNGSIVFFVPLAEDGHAPREGPRYVVQRQRPDGTAEVSVRRLVRHDDGGRWWGAGHPAVGAFPEHGGGGETVIVLGRIVRAHVKEE